MKKYLVIGNPIKHSLSPTLHNYWMKKNNIDAIYEKKKLEDNDLKDLIIKVKEGELVALMLLFLLKKKLLIIWTN